MEDDKSILDDPKYKASVQRLEDAVRDHHRLLEDWGNEHDEGEPDQTMVVGWVLVIGQVGFNDGKEFHSAVVEYPDTLNTFHAEGLAGYGHRFIQDGNNDFTLMGDAR
ncbi:hypothetical protein SEA_TINYMINY_9 [Microbacterium phage TinyMiny]|nr:hypothetical protein SEA_TINYMINY_9 [Microbacterium phage TinyMiny]